MKPLNMQLASRIQLRQSCLTLNESSEARTVGLGISPRTADRLWAYARPWLRVEIKSGRAR
jgi:hypothetical protein